MDAAVRVYLRRAYPAWRSTGEIAVALGFTPHRVHTRLGTLYVGGMAETVRRGGPRIRYWRACGALRGPSAPPEG